MERTENDQITALLAHRDQLDARLAHVEARVNKAAARFGTLHAKGFGGHTPNMAQHAEVASSALLAAGIARWWSKRTQHLEESRTSSWQSIALMR